MTQPTNNNLLDPAELNQLGNLNLIARTLVDGHLAGKHRSPYFGGSIEFAEHRNYTPGDETRLIDYHALARTDRYYIKQYQRDTNLHATVVLDNSASMNFALSTITKLRYAQILTAALARLLLTQRDNVGLALTCNPTKPIPARSNPSYLNIIIDALENLPPADSTPLHQTLYTLASQSHKRCLVIICSDCFDDTEKLLAALAHLKSRHCETILFHILAPEEISFPFNQWSRFENLESPVHHLNTDPVTIRNQYLENFHNFLTQLETGARERGCDYQLITTDLPVGQTLAQYLAGRKSIST